MELAGVYPISIKDFEKDDVLLKEAKQNRSRIEYYFTCTPSFVLYVFDTFPDMKDVAYLDADLFFFSDPSPIYKEIGNSSIAIIPHRYDRKLRHLEMFGIYNVGFVFFRRDEKALTCLQRWREQCIEWCYDRVEDDRFADQKYLDEWPQRYNNLVVIQHKGANLAPWNISNWTLSRHNDCIHVNNQSLIFFHFHGLKKINRWMYDPNVKIYRTFVSDFVKQNIFSPYINLLRRLEVRTAPLVRPVNLRNSLIYQIPKPSFFKLIWQIIDKTACFLLLLFTRTFLLVMGDRIR